ncbi:MAG: hypothetical protein M3436_03395 [Pseudomonadota bacterium]|nr:hypothetical protein [Pseudomonadota bacterium]
MEANDKVQILLKEYDTLRAEILQRIAHRFASLGLIGAMGAYAFFIEEQLIKDQIIVLTISVIVVGVNRFQQGNLIRRCSNRIAEIEVAVNSLAEGKLLVWEHEKRGSKIFHKLYNGGIRAEAARPLYFSMPWS